jgi:hypothetical protein
MNILLKDIDVLEELIVDAIVAALLLGVLDRVELIKGIYGDVGKRYLTLLVALYQLAVETQRCATRSQAEDKWR